MQSNEDLIDHLVKAGALKTKQVIGAFRKVDRADFVPSNFLDEAYGDYPLPIGYGQTISQPYTVAFMLELLKPKPGEKILDVGSGSGWTTALLAAIVGERGRVIGVEIVPQLVEFGKKNLKKHQFSQASIVEGGDTLGWPQEAPYDRILVSAAADELPAELVEQLKVGGRIVIPLEGSVWSIDKKAPDRLETREFPGFVFVPLRRRHFLST